MKALEYTLFAIFLVVVIKIFFVKISKLNLSKEPSSNEFKLKNSVLNQAENAFYQVLKQELPEKFILLSKVRIEDFVEVVPGNKTYLDIQSLRSKVKSRHVDFLVCTADSAKPVLAIELDGPDHFKKSIQERDIFVDTLYKNIGLNIKHVSVGSNYAAQVQTLKNFLTSL